MARKKTDTQAVMNLLDFDVLADFLKDADLEVVADYEPVDRLPSGIATVDLALGGGWARGRINEVMAKPSYGKSLMLTLTAARTVADGGKVFYLDTEGTFDPRFAHDLGLDTDGAFRLIQMKGDTPAEKALDVILGVIKSGQYDLIILDSKDALMFQPDHTGEGLDERMGYRAKKFNMHFTQANRMAKETNTTYIVVSHIHTSMEGIEITTGGEKLKFFASIRLKLYKPQPIKDGDEEIGQDFTGYIDKNKTAKRNMKFDFRIQDFETAGGKMVRTLDAGRDIFDTAVACQMLTNTEGEVYEKGVGNIFFKDTKLGSKNEAIDVLREDVELRNTIESAIREKMEWW